MERDVPAGYGERSSEMGEPYYKPSVFKVSKELLEKCHEMKNRNCVLD